MKLATLQAPTANVEPWIDDLVREPVPARVRTGLLSRG